MLAFALRLVGAAGAWTVTVALLSDPELRALHLDFLGIDDETDVMTFPAGASALDGGGGDIAISVDRAALQAPDWRHSTLEEVRFLAVHGLLHLCGWVDHEPVARERMLGRQREIIAAYGNRGN